MADPALSTGQYSIGRDGGPGFVFGRGANSIQIQNTATDTGTPAVQDQAVVGHDGMLFGIDTLPGMVIIQTGFAYTSPAQGSAAMDAYSSLAGWWNDPTIRLTDGAVQVFRAYYPGSSVVRRCYGRGRKIVPVMGQVFMGVVPFTSQFQCADNTWYSDTLQSVNMTTRPSYYGTFTPPVTPPYQLSAVLSYQDAIVNIGTLPTWPVITIHGPISYPGYQVVNTQIGIEYLANMSASDTLVIDTRPWARTAMLNGNTSVAGLLTGSAMIALQAQPGATRVRLLGQDKTGTATMTVSWRSATLAIGGTVI